jgi:hypothetical protein
MRKKLTYANAMSTLAVMLALGGTSYAAATISGASVKDESLTGRDVKNESLTGRDVRNRSLGAVDFRAGELPEGERGAQGAPGPAGERGPSNAVANHVDGPVPANGVIVAVKLPAGAWIVDASAQLNGAADCELDPEIETDAVPSAAAEDQAVAMTRAVTIDEPREVALVCDGEDRATVANAAITAVQVAELDDQSIDD